MDWLPAIDLAVFRLINQQMANPLLDLVMPFFSWNRLFIPVVVLVAVGLIVRGGVRGRVCLAMLVLMVALGDTLVCNSLKDLVQRPRPSASQEDTRAVAGKGSSGSFPSSHAANWFAASVVFGLYYRRSLYLTLPLATTVALSRVYVGAHYPSDVVAGALLGAGYAAGGVWLADVLWRVLGRRWFPLWWERLPSLRKPTCRQAELPPHPPSDALRDRHWLRLGYVLLTVLLLARLGYLAAGKIELSEDEAYQWVWSKHLALSYYSKPPLIAYTQALGTALWGDNAFGVRFFSPVISTILGWALLRFFAREVNAQVGLLLILALTAMPLLAVGSILMTIDPLSVLFWTLAMFTGWRAVQADSTARWALTGLWMGLGFLSKYTELLQWLSWAVFFLVWKPARRQLRRPGPYLALWVNLLCALPVLIWNAQHGWVTVTHVSEVGHLDRAWHPTIGHLIDFVGAEMGLLNPVFFVAMIWALIAGCRDRRLTGLGVFCFSMGAPVFLVFLLLSLHSRILPNWIAPSVVPLFCGAAIYWDTRWRSGVAAIKGWLIGGLCFGLLVVAVLHETDLIRKLTGDYLPPRIDPLRRVRGWSETARIVGEARRELLEESAPVFIIGGHYGITGQLSFYLPEAKAVVPDDPLVYCIASDKPQNQFYFWPGYEKRAGQNAIYVQVSSQPVPPPERLLKEFASVTDLGLRDVVYRGRVLRRLQLFACRGLR